MYVNMMARGGAGGGAARKSAMGQRIVAILPYIKQEIPVMIVFRFTTIFWLCQHVFCGKEDKALRGKHQRGY